MCAVVHVLDIAVA